MIRIVALKSFPSRRQPEQIAYEVSEDRIKKIFLKSFEKDLKWLMEAKYKKKWLRAQKYPTTGEYLDLIKRNFDLAMKTAHIQAMVGIKP